jgi:hypothetical protein
MNMVSVRRACLAASMTFLATTAMAGDRNPVGEKANYELDRNSSRTSSLIQSGSLSAEVTQHLPDADGGAAYEAKIDYQFRITLVGNRSGTEYVNAPEEYFTEQFLIDLRANGHYESPQFKIDHEGYANARTLDGRTYENCDKVKIYDIDQGYQSTFVDLARALVISTLGPVTSTRACRCSARSSST